MERRDDREKGRKQKLEIIGVVIFFMLYEGKIFAPKNVFSFLPFYLFVVSHFCFNWCMAVMR